MSLEHIERNYHAIKKTIPPHVQLLVVSKTRSTLEIQKLYELGQRDFGENRVSELKEKSTALSHLSEIRWHMIGHIQSNKLNQLLTVEHLYSIHSLHGPRLAKLLADKQLTSELGVYIEDIS